jgi:hypothetical protein
LFPSDSQAADRFGASVAVIGDAALIGDPHDGENGFHAGAAYVFGYDGQSWVEEQKLLLIPGNHEDYFGASVSLSGDVALIGAPRYDDVNGKPDGVAFVFRFDGTTWVEEQQLLPSGGGGGGNFVSLSGDTAVIGASLDGDNGFHSGAVFIYSFNGINWIEEKELHSSDGAAGDEFGSSVSLSGDTAIIGAPFDDDAGVDSGSAYAFDLSRCLPCPADVNHDDAVGPADLAEMLASWGLCDDCPADIDPPGGDGVVWPPDLAALLAAWGQCPQ